MSNTGGIDTRYASSIPHPPDPSTFTASTGQSPPLPTSADDDNDDEQAPATDAATKLAHAIDDFLGDLERKFKGISEEVLNRLDDMAERCDRLEADLLAREAVSESAGPGPGPVKEMEES